MADNEFGYGQESPGDSSGEYNAIMFMCQQVVAKMDTAKLVVVKAVTGGGENAPAGTVDVQPLVSQIDGNGYGTAHGIVPGIPWIRLGAGTNAVIMDPKVGDIGYVTAMDRDISKVKSTKAPALPGTRRKFNIADGVYIGAVLAAAPTCYLMFSADGHVKVVDVDGNVVETSSTGIAITPKSGQPVTINGNLVVTGNLELQGGIQSQTGGTYTGDIHTTGSVFADTEVQVGTGAAKVTLTQHQHSANNTPPTPGH